MNSFFEAETKVYEALRPLTRQERERMEALIEAERARPVRRWLAGALVRLGARLDPEILVPRALQPQA